MGMVYGKAAFNAFLEMLPIGILLSSKEKGSFSERSFPQNILFCTIAFAETKSSTASREQKLSLGELPEPDRDDVDFGRFSSFYARKTAYFSAF